MPRQNAATTGSAVNLRAAAQSIRATASSGTFDDLRAALSLAASAFDNAQNAIEILESRIRDLAQPNTNQATRQAPMTVSGDRIRGGVQVQGLLQNVMGQGVDYTFTSQVGHITGFDHGTGLYLEVDIDGSPVAINGHSGGVTISGTVTLTTPLPVPSGGTGTATGSITGTGDLTFTAGGSNKTVTLVSSGTGRAVLKPGTDSTTAIQLQNAAGTAVASVDTTNKAVTISGRTIGSTTDSNTGFAAGTGQENFRAINADSTVNNWVELAFYDAGGSIGSGIGAQNVDQTNHYQEIAFYTRGPAVGFGERMRITSVGNVGIGTATATAPLQVVGVPVYANNAAAVLGGLTAGALYRTGADPDPVSVVH